MQNIFPVVYQHSQKISSKEVKLTAARCWNISVIEGHNFYYFFKRSRFLTENLRKKSVVIREFFVF